MPVSSDTLAALAAVAGPAAVRAGAAVDAIDGVQPAAVVEPDTPEGVARVLASASQARLNVVIRGGGTKMSWGRPPGPIDIVLSTRRLARVISHAHGDLTAEVQAGVALEAMNAELGKERQWLPLESAFERATIGGMLATNDAGPVQHRFGTPRDLLIGVHLATTDGRIVKAGGNVVKNVAGYDLGKLVTGSFGTLAAIVSATFKLTPMSPAVGTQSFTFADRAAAASAVQAMTDNQLDPVALEVRAGSPVPGSEPRVGILVRFASTAHVVETEMGKAAQLMNRFESRPGDPVFGADDEALWKAHRARPWSGAGAVIRVSWLPASLDAVIAFIGHGGGAGTAMELNGRAGVGTGLLRVDGAAAAQIDVVRRLRDRSDLFGQATILRAEPAVKAAVDVWGGDRDTAALQAAVKRAFDPAGILSAGRGPW